MDRTDRLLLEHQINDLDGMIRQMTNMRSVLVRRTNRMVALPTNSAPRLPGRPSNASRQAHIIEQIDPDLMDHWRNNANEENINNNVAMALIRMFDDEDEDVEDENPIVPNAHQFVPQVPFVGIISKPKQKVSVIKKADLIRNMPEPCFICQENYTKLESLTANCGHGCCKGCMTQWLETKHNATCPLCRVKVTTITGYRERAKPRRKVTVVDAIEDENEDANSMDVVV